MLVATVALLLLPGFAGAASAPRVFAVAGSGERQFGGDGGPATDAGGEPYFVAALPHGGFLFSEPNKGRVRMVNSHGIITTVAGSGSFSYPEPLGDGGPATRASLNPSGLAVLPGGGFLVSDGHGRVRMVSPQGVISTVAGAGPTGPVLPMPTGTARPIGEGGPATSASLQDPEGLAVLPGGGFLIADASANRVRMVNAHGIITTVAGTGAARSSGDGGPATRAGLYGPCAVAVLPGGGFLIAEQYGDRIRRVDARGIISTVAGIGPPRGSLTGSLGDGGPATRAILYDPSEVAALPGGGFLIADVGDGRVRHVDAHGIITTVAGASQWAQSGRVAFPIEPARQLWSGLSDGLGGPATAVRLNPTGLAVEPDGSVLIAAENHVLMLATGRHPPLAVAIRPPTLVAGAIQLKVAASEPGREQVQVSSTPNGARVAALTRNVPAGVTDLGLPRLPSGALVVRVILTAQGRLATDETAIVTDRVLPVSLARTAIASYCCGGAPAVVAARRAKRAQDEEEETPPSVISCHRFTPTRVDCQWGWQGRCAAAASAVLRNVLVYLTVTNSCTYAKHPRHHGVPWIAPLL